MCGPFRAENDPPRRASQTPRAFGLQVVVRVGHPGIVPGLGPGSNPARLLGHRRGQRADLVLPGAADLHRAILDAGFEPGLGGGGRPMDHRAVLQPEAAPVARAYHVPVDHLTPAEGASPVRAPVQDGLDPRTRGGAVAASAAAYTPGTPIVITFPTTVRARVRSGT